MERSASVMTPFTTTTNSPVGATAPSYWPARSGRTVRRMMTSEAVSTWPATVAVPAARRPSTSARPQLASAAVTAGRPAPSRLPSDAWSGSTLYAHHAASSSDTDTRTAFSSSCTYGSSAVTSSRTAADAATTTTSDTGNLSDSLRASRAMRPASITICMVDTRRSMVASSAATSTSGMAV